MTTLRIMKSPPTLKCQSIETRKQNRHWTGSSLMQPHLSRRRLQVSVGFIALMRMRILNSFVIQSAKAEVVNRNLALYIHTYIHTNAKIKVTLSQNCCRGLLLGLPSIFLTFFNDLSFVSLQSFKILCAPLKPRVSIVVTGHGRFLSASLYFSKRGAY